MEEVRVHTISLGCPKNFVDTELASASFLCAGFGLAADDESADIQFINTCAFLKEARKEASSVIQALKSWKRKMIKRSIAEYDSKKEVNVPENNV